MTFSTPVLGTKNNKTKISWFQYYFTHVFPTGFQTIKSSFRMWADLLTGNYAEYALLKTDDPFIECRAWFFDTLGEDEVLPKEFLEHLLQMAEDVRSGKEKVIPFTKDMFDDLKDLVGDMIEDTDTTGTLDPADD
jgi:hypothetical protein